MHEKAALLLKSMSTEQVLSCWNAIQKGGLEGTEVVRGIPVDDWVMLVHSEMEGRTFGWIGAGSPA